MRVFTKRVFTKRYLQCIYKYTAHREFIAFVGMSANCNVGAYSAASSIPSVPIATIPNKADVSHIAVVPDADGGTKKNNKKRNKERVQRARVNKAIDSDGVDYSEMCEQLACMQKELNAMKTRVGFSRPIASNKTCAVPAVLERETVAAQPAAQELS